VASGRIRPTPDEAADDVGWTFERALCLSPRARSAFSTRPYLQLPDADFCREPLVISYDRLRRFLPVYILSV
jgi:hypothetical protein